MDTEVLYILIAVAGLLGAGIGWLGKQSWYRRKARRQATGDAEVILLNKKELLEAMLTKEKDTEQKIHLTRQIEVTDFQLLDLYERSYSRTLQDADLPPLETLVADGRQKLNPKQIDEIDNISNKLDALQPSVSVKDLGFLASAYYYAERYQEAKNILNQLLERNPRDPDILSNRGLAYVELKKYEEALVDYNLSLEVRPDRALTLTNRGNTYYELTRYEKALADYNRSLKIKPNHAPTLNNRGNTNLKLKSYEEALADYNRSLKLEPNSPRTLFNRACLFSIMEKPRDAISDLEKAIALDSKYREMAKTDKDFDNIRDDPRFKKLIEPDK